MYNFFNMKSILLVSLILKLNSNAISAEIVNIQPIVLSLNINVSQSNLIKLILDSTSKDVTLFKYYDKADYQLSLQDLLFLYLRKEIVDIDLKEVLNYLAVNFNDLKNLFVLYDFDYECVRTLKINLKSLYLSFLSFLSEPDIQIRELFASSALDEFIFSNAYLNGTEYEVFQVLATGNFSQKFINEMAGILNSGNLWNILHLKTTSSFVQRLELIVGNDAVSLMRNLGVSQLELAKILSPLIESLQDLDHKPAYRDLLNALQEIQDENIFGTWISSSQNLITANSALLQLYDNGQEYLTLTTVVNKKQIALVPERFLKLSNDLIVLNIKNFDEYFPENKIINSGACYYYSNAGFMEIPLDFAEPRVNSNNIFNISHLISTTLFVIGSPIICNNKLIGVATKYYSNSTIIFGFYYSTDDTYNTVLSNSKSEFLVREKRGIIFRNNPLLLTKIWENFFTILKGFLSSSCRC